ncbi:unnamed protein product [Eretmochelys imbricata]
MPASGSSGCVARQLSPGCQGARQVLGLWGGRTRRGALWEGALPLYWGASGIGGSQGGSSALWEGAVLWGKKAVHNDTAYPPVFHNALRCPRNGGPQLERKQCIMGRERAPPSIPQCTAGAPEIGEGVAWSSALWEGKGGPPHRYGVPVQTSQPSMDQYSILGRIGEGAHGIVFKAKNIESGETVALKKVALRRLEDGIPNQALREIKALQEIEENQHVVKLKAVFPHGAGFVLVFEYMLSDLAEVIRNAQQPLTQAQVKGYMLMLLQGVAFCHANNIMHRDLKPANLLISSAGQLKIADFGLARVFSSDTVRLYSHQVATRWYRAPELLYGARKYDEGVDLWAVAAFLPNCSTIRPSFLGRTTSNSSAACSGCWAPPASASGRRSRNCLTTTRSRSKTTRPSAGGGAA